MLYGCANVGADRNPKKNSPKDNRVRIRTMLPSFANLCCLQTSALSGVYRNPAAGRRPTGALQTTPDTPAARWLPRREHHVVPSIARSLSEMQGSVESMSDPDLRVEIEVQDIEAWLSTKLPAWSTVSARRAPSR